MAILGISTNTRLLGLAILKQGSLVEYKVHLHKSSWSPSKAKEIITKLEPCVRQYCIKSCVLSTPNAYHQTEAYKSLVSCIRSYFKEKNIPVYAKESKTVHSLYSPEQKKTKKVLMKLLTEQYPQLTYCYRKEVRNKNKYYIKLFEAVAVATLHGQKS